MKTYKWGPHLWKSIHYIALGYSEDPSPEESRHFQSFFENLHQVIPCYNCSLNYIKHLNERPLTINDLKNNFSLFKWTVDIHNIVNKELKKNILSYEDAYKLYNNTTENDSLNSANRDKRFLFAFIIILLVIGVFFLQSRKFRSYFIKMTCS